MLVATSQKTSSHVSLVSDVIFPKQNGRRSLSDSKDLMLFDDPNYNIKIRYVGATDQVARRLLQTLQNR